MNSVLGMYPEAQLRMQADEVERLLARRAAASARSASSRRAAGRGRIAIRAARPADAALVHRLVLEIAAHEGSLDALRSDVDDWRRMLRRSDVTVLLAVDGDEVLGYASTTRRLNLWLGEDVVALDDLYVREQARNRGVGRRLMAAVAGLAAPESLTVTWGARLDNVDGHRFYRRLGALLTTKVVASWSPSAYRSVLRGETASWE